VVTGLVLDLEDQWPWPQRLLALALASKSNGLGLKDYWHWPWPQRPMALALALILYTVSSNLSLEYCYVADTLAGHDVFDSTTVTDTFSPVIVPPADEAVGMLRGLSVGIPLV